MATIHPVVRGSGSGSRLGLNMGRHGRESFLLTVEGSVNDPAQQSLLVGVLRHDCLDVTLSRSERKIRDQRVAQQERGLYSTFVIGGT